MIHDQNPLLRNMAFNTNQWQYIKPNKRFTNHQNATLIASLHTSAAITLPTRKTHGYSTVITISNYGSRCKQSQQTPYVWYIPSTTPTNLVNLLINLIFLNSVDHTMQPQPFFSITTTCKNQLHRLMHLHVNTLSHTLLLPTIADRCFDAPRIPRMGKSSGQDAVQLTTIDYRNHSRSIRKNSRKYS